MSKKLPEIKNTITVVGLGYVGLPLLIEFSKQKQNLSWEKSQKDF